MSYHEILQPIERWFQQKGWTPQDFQRETWTAFLDGHSGLVQVPTGAGKTYAAYMGPLAELMALDRSNDDLSIVFLTPLRATSRDIEAALRRPIEDLDLPFTVESRTGDTSSYRKAKQKKQMPNVLVTTPESLSLLLTHKEAYAWFCRLRAVIVDEWHELMHSKRGIQTELVLARLRGYASDMRTWALSATLGNPEEAARAAVGELDKPVMIRAALPRPLHIETLLPESVDSFPWAGHLGLHLLPKLLDWLNPELSTLIFTNTRSQAERWYQALRFSRPEWEDRLGLHHGSIDREERTRIEEGLNNGNLSLVVCTASLDLGVDFAPVARVVQIGSAKGVARLLQRAGRSGHQPGKAAHLLYVPTHALELLEIQGIRRAIAQGLMEDRPALIKPYDVLSQHLVTCALGDGFEPGEMFLELQTTRAYATLLSDEFRAVLAFIEHGGDTLQAYPQFHKVKQEDGRYVVQDQRTAKLHRFNIGTITADASLKVAYVNGPVIGHVEERFVAKLKRGDIFVFAGKRLEFVRMKQMTAQVRAASRKGSLTPHWPGGRMPISALLAKVLREALYHHQDHPERVLIQPILEAQARLSHVPKDSELLMEIFTGREGRHLFVFPFEGARVHEGLAALLAVRLGRHQPTTFAISANDYGFELLAPKDYPYLDLLGPNLFSPEDLEEDIRAGMNLSELAKRAFRDIAQISGLVLQGYPGSPKTGKQLQMSSGLLYDVFENHDPHHLLKRQAEREVLEDQLEQTRLVTTLKRLWQQSHVVKEVSRPTPFGFPLVIERLSARLSYESLKERIERLKQSWGKK